MPLLKLNKSCTKDGGTDGTGPKIHGDLDPNWEETNLQNFLKYSY
jgi:hypothetical protein